MNAHEFIKQVRAFDLLGPQALENISLKSEQKFFKKGDFIFREGQPSEIVWLIQQGWVHLIKGTSSGKPFILFTMSRREILCGVSAFDQEPYAADGVAATDANLLKIPAPLFVGCLNSNPQFCREVLSICSGRIRKIAQRLAESQDSVSHRIARLFLASIADFGHEIPFTHREISQMIGTRIETSIRTLASLREKNLIRIKRSCIEVDSIAKLTKELETWLVESK